MKRGKPRRRSEVDKERWESAWQPFCAVCGIRPTQTCHHVVHAQHVRSRGGDEWSPDNALPICGICHSAHHSRNQPIPTRALLRVNHEFAFELLGGATGAYFDRYYETNLREVA